MSKYEVFPGLYFPAFGLNTERYGVIRTRKNSVFGHFSRSGCMGVTYGFVWDDEGKSNGVAIDVDVGLTF